MTLSSFIQNTARTAVGVFSLIVAMSLHAAKPPNVLFIAVDDLRPQIFSFGQEKMVTPNIDRLAKQGVLFQRAYCMVPTCGASRASLMTSIRPARDRFTTHLTYAEKDAKGITTLNTHFKNHGYHTVSLGKIFHHPSDNAQGWSEEPWRPKSTTYAKKESMANARKKAGKSARGLPYESADVADDFYGDGKLADRAIADLKRLGRQEQPFFLAVGFFKPHLPFVAPDRYWNRYPESDVRMPDNYHAPKDAPREAIHSSGELRAYANVPPKGVIPEDLARKLIRGYHACVSYTDQHIGRLLDELENAGLKDNTIVVLWGDHGWNLGEHTLWCKHCCFETSMNAPLIISAPMLKGVARGKKSMALTEFIDIYPSLCELAGLPIPRHVQGKSFLPVLKNPTGTVKDFAIGRFGGGDTIRTDRYRFTVYSDKKGAPVARMLYDHVSDPGENVNISERSENAEVVGALAARLAKEMGKPAAR